MIPVVLPAGIDCACERNRWERRPGDGGTIIACAECGTIAAIPLDGTGAEYSPGVSLHKVTLTLCSLCILGEGGQCHTPGCAMWIKSAPDVKLSLEPWNEPPMSLTILLDKD